MSKQSNSETLPTPPSDEEQGVTKKVRRKKRRRSRISKLYAKFRRHFRFGIAFIFIITIAFSGAMVISVRISDASNQLDASWQRLNRVLSAIKERQGADITLEEFPRISLGVSDLGGNVRSMQRQLNLVSPAFELDINEEWEISSQLVDATSELVNAADHMLDGVAPVVNFLQPDENSTIVSSQISDGEQLVDLFEINQENFRDASESLVDAQNQLGAIDLSVATLDQIHHHQQLEYYYQQLSDFNSILLSSSDILAQFMGLDEEVTYLILAQNNDSMRPSGGKVEAYGWFSVRNGRLTGFDFSASTLSSPVPPNSSFTDILSIPSWWIAYETALNAAWEGSWYADFPSTGQMALDYYNAGGNYNSPVNGIIAVDFESLQQIISVLGEVNLPEIEEPLTTSNFRDVIYNPDNYGIQTFEQYIATVYKTVFADLQHIDRRQSLQLLTVILEGLVQHNVMVYVPDPEIQATIDLLGWSGAQIKPNADDYLLVADTNLTNKSNHSVVRSLTYDVEILPDNSRLSNLSVRYDYFNSVASGDPAINPDFFGSRDYRTLTQIYLPKDSSIVEESNTVESTSVELDDYKLFVTQLNVEYDSSEQMSITYETPPSENPATDLFNYRILIEKQPGLPIQDIELQVKLPTNANIIWVSQEPNAYYALDQQVFDFRLQIVSDQWVEIVYSLN